MSDEHKTLVEIFNSSW